MYKFSAIIFLATLASVLSKDLPSPKTSFILSEPGEQVSFDQSNRICKSHGNMKPVSILNREKHLEVLTFMASYDIPTVWTSGNDLEVRSNYIWTGIDTPFDYTNWLLDAPLEDESCRCVGFKYGSGSSCPGNSSKCAGWTVEPCDKKFRVLCEMDTTCFK